MVINGIISKNMIHEILGDIFLFGLVVLVCFFIDFKTSIKYWYILILFFIVGLADNISYTVTAGYPTIQIIKTDIWNDYLDCNWSAKIYSIFFALVIMFLFRGVISSQDIGLRVKQNKQSIKFSICFIIFFFITAIFVGLSGKKGEFDLKVLAYLAIMPGLNEELIYRGFLLGFLNKIFDRKFRFLNTNFGWGVILISIVFGLLHGFQITETYQIQLDNVSNVILTGVFGFIFALMKERSGSLLFPIIGHSTIDFFHYLFRML